MTVTLFEGAAGTGKTTRLFEEAVAHLRAFPLSPDQRVLALTRLHGARRRLAEKLSRRSGFEAPSDCRTIDSFSWNLVRRWRGLARHLGLAPAAGDFHSIRAAAGILLCRPSVANWVARRYPLLLIDELQDCGSGELEILTGLSGSVRCIAAADWFQDLTGEGVSEALAWARASGTVITLDQVHRTNAPGLLSAALAIRDGSYPLPPKGGGFELISVPSPALAGAIISWRIKSWSKLGRIAVIATNRASVSRFVDRAVEWTAEKRANAKSGATAGPYPLIWEQGDEEAQAALVNSLGLARPGCPAEIDCEDLTRKARELGADDIAQWAHDQEFLAGRQAVAADEATEAIRSLLHRRRAFSPPRARRRSVMTIYQAKNREFETVIVLWSVKVRKHAEQQRRWLYNAITRAKRNALVLVEDQKGDRARLPPFAAS